MLFIIYRLLKNVMPHDSSVFRWYHTRYAKSHLVWASLHAMQYPPDLVYLEPRDPLWGGDGAGVGKNELGKSLMRVRERLRGEEE
jgi:hypothetical protein